MLIKLFWSFLKGRLHRRWNKNISRTSFIARRVQLLGVSNMVIGDNCVIGEGTIINVNIRENGHKSLKIGSNTYIGRNNFILAGKNIEIGEYCLIGNNCSIICGDHDFHTPLVPYNYLKPTNEKEIFIGTNCYFGINVTVVGNIKIGHGCIIGANTLVSDNIPPFSIVLGNPARIIKRYDFESCKWISSEELPDTPWLNEETYLKYLKERFQKVPLAYFSGSSDFGDII